VADEPLHIKQVQQPEQLERARTMVTRFLVGRFVHLRTANRDSLEGQGLVEYALLIMFVAIVCVGAVAALGDEMLAQFWSVIRDVLIPALGA
jgi:Flp pilus assembly pilin Flp